MKSLLYTVCIIGVCVSCDLDEFPLDKLAPENYFNNEEELKTFTNTFYQQNLPGAASVYSEGADVIICTTLQDEVAGRRVVVNEGGGWTTGDWSPLTYINNYLSYSHRCDDARARAHYDAVARFFRAYFYFEKVKRFGDVPWYDSPLASDDPALYKARDPREYVMSKVLEDIDYAVNNTSLPTSVDVYSVTHWTALALKSRICLFEGTFRKYHGMTGWETYLDECIEASEAFIDNSPYQIYSGSSMPYRDLFASNNAISAEVILARDYDKSMSIVHNANNYTLSSTYGMPGLNKKIVDSYLMQDGSRFTDISGYDKLGFYAEMQNRDPRLTQTVRGPGYTRIGEQEKLSPDFSFTTTGYHLIKWVTDKSQDGYNNSYNDIILFRAAEVYLNFAEAKAERGTLQQSDIDKSIKPIRERVGMPNLDMAKSNADPDPYLESGITGYPNVDKGPNKGVILEIRRERTIELIDEGHRYYDMIRWKEGKMFEQEFTGMYFAPIDAADNPNRNAGYRVYDLDGDGKNGELDVCLYTTDVAPSVSGVRTFFKVGSKFALTGETGGNIIVHNTQTEPREWREERDYLYPIPLSQILLSAGNIQQNPYWDE